MSQIKPSVLLLTKQLNSDPKGGREMLSKLNHDALYNILGMQLIVFELPQTKPVKLHEIFESLRGNIDGLSTKIFEEVILLIRRKKVYQVFVDGSNLGAFVAKLKRTLPEIEVITFFHNVEARFFWGALRGGKTLRALAIFIVNYLAERKATLQSDKRICLSERDSRLLRLIYGKGATHIAPMALEDKLVDCTQKVEIGVSEPFALFVGGNFYANREGIAWFVKNVIQRIGIKIFVVGQGMENIRAELEISDKVVVIGPVDNLAGWYGRSRFVIAPVFDGSGMKTKVAEALMYGKKVVGTPEAFSGYEDILETAGWSCTNPDEFVSAIQTAQHSINVSFDPVLREIYESRYSLFAATVRLSQVLSVEPYTKFKYSQ